ncbi:MAG TPA: hypothetical protein VMP01_27580 [Pirellulaceae bacterium]|nr:hypothetical protein [Pirellulaceae bacterium]
MNTTSLIPILIAFTFVGANGAETTIASRDEDPPPEITLHTTLKQEDYYRVGRMLFQMSYVEREHDDPARPLTASLAVTYDVPQNARTNPWKSAIKDYYMDVRFREGDVLPLSSALYRVEKLANHAGQAGARREGFAVLKRVEEEWARDLAPAPDSYILVLNRGSGLLHNAGLNVTNIELLRPNESSSARATIRLAIGAPPQLSATFTAERSLVLPTWEQQPKVYLHRIRRVVPLSKAIGVPGWIELDPEPIAVRTEPEPIIYSHADAEPPRELKIETTLGKADYCRLGRLLFRMYRNRSHPGVKNWSSRSEENRRHLGHVVAADHAGAVGRLAA